MHRESLRASGVTTTLNINEGVDNDHLNHHNDDDDYDVMDILCDIFGVSSRNNNMNVNQDERMEANFGASIAKNDNTHYGLNVKS